MSRNIQVSADTDDSVRDGEFAFGDSDFREIALLIKDMAGIDLADTKKPLVYSRLAKRLRALSLSSFSEYCALVRSPDGIDERNHMLNSLTTNVTRFFREPHHFELLKTEVLPPLIERAKRGGRVRLWSSACSSGEEVYSIALTVMSVFPEVARYDFKILATDIDQAVLQKARAGVYRSQLVEPVPSPLKKKFFQPAQRGGEQLAIASEIKSLITFRPLNLIASWPIKGTFDVVFCRNVVIYFDRTTQQSLWQRFADHIAPGGWLMIGHSERITGDAVSQFTHQGHTAFQKCH